MSTNRASNRASCARRQWCRTTAVPGRYQALLSEDWCAPEVPQGGVATAVALRAMAAALDVPEQALRTVDERVRRAGRSGPVEVDVTVLRRGRTLSQLTATMRNPGAAAGHTSVAVFGGPRPGFEFTDRVLPTCRRRRSARRFATHSPRAWRCAARSATGSTWKARPALGHPPWENHEPTSSQRAYWMRFDDPPILEDGTIDPFALVTLCDTQPGAVGERMGSNVPMWLPPSVDLTVHVFGVPTSEWLLSPQPCALRRRRVRLRRDRALGPGAGADRLRDPDHAVPLSRWPADPGSGPPTGLSRRAGPSLADVEPVR